MGVCVVMKVCEIETLSLLVQMSGRIYINIFSFFLHFPLNNNRGDLVYAINFANWTRKKSFHRKMMTFTTFFVSAQAKPNGMTSWNIVLRSSQYFIDFDPNHIVREQKTYLHKNGNVYKEFDLGCAVQESTFEFWV